MSRNFGVTINEVILNLEEISSLMLECLEDVMSNYYLYFNLKDKNLVSRLVRANGTTTCAILTCVCCLIQAIFHFLITC